MLQNTAQFVIFFIATAILYYLLPIKTRKYYLCLVNFIYAYLIGGVSTVIVVVLISVFTYFTAFAVEKTKHGNLTVGLFCVVVLGILFYGKYLNFTLGLVSSVISVPADRISVITMIGISYYVLSAISYIVDVYRKKDTPDKNYIDVLIFMSLFTKLVAGPIERHDSFKNQMNELEKVSFDSERIKRGFMIAAWGYFQKMIIADRTAMFVDNAFEYLDERSGFTLLVAAILYALQVYLDFAGYSNIALGVSHIFGIKITNNFRRPFFATSITELWRRWHISLSNWLKDYIYIPLGGSRKGKVRQYFNLIVTFVISGIWHGAALSYAFWGFINGIYQVVEKGMKDLNIKPLPEKYNFVKRIWTFVLFSFSTIFFRAPSLRMGLTFVRRMFSEYNPWVLFDGTLHGMGLEQREWTVLILALIVFVVVESLQEKGVSIYKLLNSQPMIVRWLCYYAIIILLLVYGIYGSEYDASNFIYFKF